MKRRAKLISLTSLALLMVCALAAGAARAKDKEKYIISAKAGVINLVSGNVLVQRRGEMGERGLTTADELQSGDRVVTGWGGRVEVLLNPGSYMRVDGNSEFELADASLDDLRIKFIKGNAVVEVTGADGSRFEIKIDTPHADALITRSGIYRFSIPAGERTEIFVRKGRVLVGKVTPVQVKGGQKVVLGRGAPEVTKYDKKNQDDFDLWSKERAKTLARANSKLRSSALAAAMDDYHSLAWLRGLNVPGRYYGVGMWVFNSRLNSYCFLPLGGRYWSSPYGYGYPTQYWYGGGNMWGPNTAQGNSYPVTGGGSTGGNTGGSTGGNPSPGPAPAPTSAPQPTWTPQPSRPVGETPMERMPRKTYTDGSPNR